MQCEIRRHNEHAKDVREDEFLDKFIAEYESLHRHQNSMRQRMDKITARGIAETQQKHIYDAVFRVKEERNRRAHIALLDFKNCIDRMRLGVQAQYEELRQHDELRRNLPQLWGTENEGKDTTLSTIPGGRLKRSFGITRAVA